MSGNANLLEMIEEFLSSLEENIYNYSLSF